MIRIGVTRGPQVTDSMVEAAARSWWNSIGRGSWSSQSLTVQQRYREMARAALLAALSPNS